MLRRSGYRFADKNMRQGSDAAILDLQ